MELLNEKLKTVLKDIKKIILSLNSFPEKVDSFLKLEEHFNRIMQAFQKHISITPYRARNNSTTSSKSDVSNVSKQLKQLLKWIMENTEIKTGKNQEKN